MSARAFDQGMQAFMNIMGLVSGLGVDRPNEQAAIDEMKVAQGRAVDSAYASAGNAMQLGATSYNNMLNSAYGGWRTRPGTNAPGEQQGQDNTTREWQDGWLTRYRTEGQNALSDYERATSGANSLEHKTDMARTFAKRSIMDQNNEYMKDEQNAYNNKLREADTQLQAQLQTLQGNTQRAEEIYFDTKNLTEGQIKELTERVDRDVARAMADREYATEVIGRNGAIRVMESTAKFDAQRDQAIAQLDATWQGPRDQRYQAAKASIENSIAQESWKAGASASVQTDAIIADQFTKLSTELNAISGSGTAAIGKLMGENAGTLRGAGADLMAARNKIAELEGTARTEYTKAVFSTEDRLADASRFVTDTLNKFDENTSVLKVQSAQVDNANAGLLLNARQQFNGISAQMAHQVETDLNNLAMNWTGIASQFQQLGINLDYNRTFTFAAVSPYFQQGFANATTIRGQNQQAEQIELQRQAQSGNWFENLLGGGMNIGGQLIGASIGGD